MEGEAGAVALSRSMREQGFELALDLVHPGRVARQRSLSMALLQLVPLTAQAEAMPPL